MKLDGGLEQANLIYGEKIAHRIGRPGRHEEKRMKRCQDALAGILIL
jgi:hypothetical protein